MSAADAEHARRLALDLDNARRAVRRLESAHADLTGDTMHEDTNRDTNKPINLPGGVTLSHLCAPELFTALAKMQGATRDVYAASHNPHFGSSYAKLVDILQANRAQAAAAGVSYLGLPAGPGHTVHVIGHASGQWISFVTEYHLAKTGPQQCGSANTYARRQGFSAALNCAPTDIEQDDDGESARVAHEEAERAEIEAKHGNWVKGAIEWLADVERAPDEVIASLDGGKLGVGIMRAIKLSLDLGQIIEGVRHVGDERAAAWLDGRGL